MSSRKSNIRRASRRDEMQERQAQLRAAARQARAAARISRRDPRRAAGRRHLCRRSHPGRLCRPPRFSRLQTAHVSLAGLSRTIWAGVMPPRSARSMRGCDVPVLSINGDGGFLYTGNELATAMRHRIPLVAIVFADGAFGNVRRIQQEQFGNRLIACDLANPDFVQIRRKLRRRRPARARPRRVACCACAKLFARARADADRSSRRADAQSLGIHPHAARPRALKIA